MIIYEGKEKKKVMLIMIVIGIGMIMDEGMRKEKLKKIKRFENKIED